MFDRRVNNPARPKKLTESDERNMHAVHHLRISKWKLLFRIPARSPDLNPIENIFNIVSAKLERDALRKQITHETFEQFSDRVEKTLCNIDPKLIDRTNDSMKKTIELIIKRRGRRLKY